MLNRAARRQNKGVQLPKAPEPRSVEEITKEYQQVSAAAIQSQYQIYVHTRALQECNEKMYDLNQEATHRQKLDSAKPVAATPAPTEEVKNV